MIMVMTTLNLSTGTTFEASPICRALKKKQPGSPRCQTGQSQKNPAFLRNAADLMMDAGQPDNAPGHYQHHNRPYCRCQIGVDAVNADFGQN